MYTVHLITCRVLTDMCVRDKVNDHYTITPNRPKRIMKTNNNSNINLNSEYIVSFSFNLFIKRFALFICCWQLFLDGFPCLSLQLIKLKEWMVIIIR